MLPIPAAAAHQEQSPRTDDDGANGGIRREPELPVHEAIAPEGKDVALPGGGITDQPDETRMQAAVIRHRLRSVARQAAMDPDDGIAL